MSRIETVKRDIEGRRDIERIVNVFYGRIQKDELLGPVFEKIAKVDWETHLPKMYAFWQSLLFGTGEFRGNPMAAHRKLVPLTPMDWRRFERWLALFHRTIDECFEGHVTDRMKRASENMANVIYSKINQTPDRRFDPRFFMSDSQESSSNYRAEA